MKSLKSLMFVGLMGLASAAPAAGVNVASPVPYSADNTVQTNVREECSISVALLEGLSGVTPVEAFNAQGPGRNLALEITDAQSAGNAFIGHRKSVTVKGQLYEGGKLVGNFVARRQSGGGIAGAYKGSCAVIHNCAEVIGKDIVSWLGAPTENAKLGDLK